MKQLEDEGSGDFVVGKQSWNLSSQLLPVFESGDLQPGEALQIVGDGAWRGPVQRHARGPIQVIGDSDSTGTLSFFHELESYQSFFPFIFIDPSTHDVIGS